VKLPLAADSRETAAKLAIKTSTSDPRTVRLIRIRNTLQLTTILASESLIDPLTRSGHAEIVAGPVDFWSHW
jgi:Fe-S-cluster formation regulator IscX/YfhJ